MITKEDEIKIIKILEGDMDIFDDQELTDKLYDMYLDEMPYGTQKARDGDPYEWMFDRLDEDFGHLVKVTELTQEDLENG